MEDDPPRLLVGRSSPRNNLVRSQSGGHRVARVYPSPSASHRWLLMTDSTGHRAPLDGPHSFQGSPPGGPSATSIVQGWNDGLYQCIGEDLCWGKAQTLQEHAQPTWNYRIATALYLARAPFGEYQFGQLADVFFVLKTWARMHRSMAVV